MVDQSQLQSLLERGDSEARVGDPEGAIRAYDELLTLAPGHPQYHKAPTPVTLSVRADQLVAAVENVNVVERAVEGRCPALEAAASDEGYGHVTTVRLTGSSEEYRARLGPPPGLYTISVPGPARWPRRRRR